MSHQFLVWLPELNNDTQQGIIGIGGDGLVNHVSHYQLTHVSLSTFSPLRLPSLLSVIAHGLEMRDTVGGSGCPRDMSEGPFGDPCWRCPYCLHDVDT